MIKPIAYIEEVRQVATNDEMMSRYVVRLERENEFLRGQISTKTTRSKTWPSAPARRTT